jgi:hypothetical protein
MLSTEPPLASPADLTIPICVADADEAIARVRDHYRDWVAQQKQARQG